MDDPYEEELKQVEADIQKDFEETDKEVGDFFEQKERTGWRKWIWLIGGIILIMIGIFSIASFIIWGHPLELLLLAFVMIISGILSLVFKEFNVIVW